MEGIVEGEYVAPALAVAYAAPAPVIEHAASSPAVVYTASASVSEYVAPAPAVSCAAPAPEDEPSPALVAARQHVCDLAIRGLGEGDPEMEIAVEHHLILKLGRIARRG